MKILTVCDFGNNSSANLAHPLKYWGNDVIVVGANKQSLDTFEMLYKWSDNIICTTVDQVIPEQYKDKFTLITGSDTGILNRLDLLTIVQEYIDANKLGIAN